MNVRKAGKNITHILRRRIGRYVAHKRTYYFKTKLLTRSSHLLGRFETPYAHHFKKANFKAASNDRALQSGELVC